MSTHTCYGESGMYVQGFRPEVYVLGLLEKQELIDRKIRRNRQRQDYFEAYCLTLPKTLQNGLRDCFMHGIECEFNESVIYKLLDEINEIETAIDYMEGLEPEEEKRIMLTDSIATNIERMCEFLNG